MVKPYNRQLLVLFTSILIILGKTGWVFAESSETSHTMDIPYLSQLYPVRAVVGCEPAALLMGIRYKNPEIDVDYASFLDQMPKAETNPAKGFAGSPYQNSERIRTTIYPKPLSDYANTYAEGITSDISGADLEQIKELLLEDKPVVIYATMYWKKPYYQNFMIDGEKQSLLRNNHAVLLSGYQKENNQFYIADPYNEYSPKNPYFYWIDEATLKASYDERKWAIVVDSASSVKEKQEQARLKKLQEQERMKEQQKKLEEEAKLAASRFQIVDPLSNQSIDLYWKEIPYVDASYDGFELHDVPYLDAFAIMLDQTDNYLFFDPNKKNTYLRDNEDLYLLDFKDKVLYLNEESKATLNGDFITVDQKQYLSQEDITTWLDILSKAKKD